MPDELCGVINPYALVELITGNPVAWATINNPRDYLEAVLGQPMQSLVDPRRSTLLYPRVSVQPDGSVRMLSSVESRQRIAQLMFDSAARARGIAALAARMRVPAPQLTTRLGADDAHVRHELAEMFAPDAASGTPWNPADKEWFDKGSFFAEGTEYFDPVQGALGDCYFIAALSAVAWAMPDTIAQRNRTFGPGQQDFYDIVSFFKDGAWHKVEGTEKVPVKRTSRQWVYARSPEGGEIWPAVYEKLYAKWKTSNTTDQPPYDPIAGGSPYQATVELTGRARFSAGTASNTADQLWAQLRARCAGATGATLVPVTACTYSSGDASPDHVIYDELNLVACHAYTVLGTQTLNAKRYVMLRNPWGTHGAIGGTALSSGAWNGIALGSGGVFGLQVESFKRYYSSFGGAA